MGFARRDINLSFSKEAVVFVDMQVSYETFELLESLDENVELLWIVETKGPRL